MACFPYGEYRIHYEEYGKGRINMPIITFWSNKEKSAHAME